MTLVALMTETHRMVANSNNNIVGVNLINYFVMSCRGDDKAPTPSPPDDVMQTV